jgi:uncharacterized membrane protein
VEEFFGALIVGLIIFFIPIVISIIAMGRTSGLRERIESLERRVSWLADIARHETVAGSISEAAPASSRTAPAAAIHEQPEIKQSIAEAEQVTAPEPLAAPKPVTPPAQAYAPPPAAPTVAPVSGEIAAPQPAYASAVAARVEPTPAAPPQPKRAALDWERVIAGNWLNRIGILALLVAGAFFLKFAFDNGWIIAPLRVAIGLVAGGGLLIYSRSLFKQGYVYFSEGIVALGVGVMDLSLYAGWNLYHFLDPVLAFIGMAAVTTLTLWISLARDSERLAFLTLFVGFLTPLLLNTGKDAEIGLFSYLAILNAGLLWASYARNWRSLSIGFLITIGYGLAWYLSFYEPAKLTPTVLFASLFFVEFSVLPVLRGTRSGVLNPIDTAVAFLNPIWFVPALVSTLYTDHRVLLAGAVLALAAIHYVISRRAGVPAQGAEGSTRIIYELLAVTLLAVAIAIGLRANWIIIGWTFEAAALVVAGLRTHSRYLRVEGLLLFAIATTRLLGGHFPAGHFLFNWHFATYAVVIACAAFAAYQAAHNSRDLSKGEVRGFKALEVAANGLAVLALTAELWNVPLDNGVRLLLMPLLWAAYAGILTLLGAARGSAIMQWQGAVLAFISVGGAVTQNLLHVLELQPAAPMQAFWMSTAWALEAAAFVWAGFHWRTQLSRGAGIALFVAAIGTVFIGHIDGGRFLINPRFEASAIVVACLVFAAYQARLYREVLAAREGIYYKLLGLAGNALAVSALSHEIWSLPVSQATHQLLQALLWSGYAGALMAAGVIRSSPWRTWQSLALLILAAVSVFALSLTPVQSMILLVVWSLEGAGFVWAGLRWPTFFARTIGFALLGWVAVLLVGGYVEGGRLLLNPRFAVFAVEIACLGFTMSRLQRARATLSPREASIINVINVSINVLALWGLSLEVLGLSSPYLTKQLILTVLWTGYAAVLMSLGLRRASPLLRWQSLSLLALVLVKVVAFDLSQLPLGLRILSFFALGVVLVGVSFFYQRRVQARQAEKETQARP